MGLLKSALAFMRCSWLTLRERRISDDVSPEPARLTQDCDGMRSVAEVLEEWRLTSAGQGAPCQSEQTLAECRDLLEKVPVEDPFSSYTSALARLLSTRVEGTVKSENGNGSPNHAGMAPVPHSTKGNGSARLDSGKHARAAKPSPEDVDLALSRLELPHKHAQRPAIWLPTGGAKLDPERQTWASTYRLHRIRHTFPPASGDGGTS